jgi:hypothetical protein
MEVNIVNSISLIKMSLFLLASHQMLAMNKQPTTLKELKNQLQECGEIILTTDDKTTKTQHLAHAQAIIKNLIRTYGEGCLQTGMLVGLSFQEITIVREGCNYDKAWNALIQINSRITSLQSEEDDSAATLREQLEQQKQTQKILLGRFSAIVKEFIQGNNR